MISILRYNFLHFGRAALLSQESRARPFSGHSEKKPSPSWQVRQTALRQRCQPIPQARWALEYVWFPSNCSAALEMSLLLI